MNLLIIKLIACIFMVIDHVGIAFFPEVHFLRFLGRIAFPIFAFLISKGYDFTKNKNKFIIRLFIFAIISEPIFNLLFFNSLFFNVNNIFFTLFLGVLLIDITHKKDKIDLLISKVLIVLFLSLFVDYGILGVLQIFVYNKYTNTKKELFITLLISNLMYILLPVFHLYKFGVLLSIPILYFYNFKKGYNKHIKYLFYIFYPLHLIILYIIKLI